MLAFLGGALLLPLTTEYNLARAALALCALIVTLGRPVNQRSETFPGMFLLLVSINLLAGMSVTAFVEGFVSRGPFAHELLRAAYYALIMTLALRLRGRLSTLVIGCQILLLLNLLVQIIQLLAPEMINPWIAQHYPAITTHLELSTYPWPNFRSGSIYVNPNVLAVFPPLFLTVFIQASRLERVRGLWIWITLCFVVAFLTGSRMGLILVLMVIILWYARVGQVGVRPFRASLPLGALFLLTMTAFGPGMTRLQEQGRALDIEGAISDSFSVKVELFIERLNDMGPLQWVFGDLGSLSGATQDMESAYIVTGFGLAGILWYGLLLGFLARVSNRRLPFVSIAATVTIILASLGASTVVNMAAFPAYVFVMLVDWRPSPPVVPVSNKSSRSINSQ